MALHHVVICASHAPYPPFLKIYVYGCFASVFVCAPCVCLMPTEFRIGVTGGHKPLCGVWMMGTKPGSSARAASAPLCWAVSSTTLFIFLLSLLLFEIITVQGNLELAFWMLVTGVCTTRGHLLPFVSVNTAINCTCVWFFFPFVSFGNDFIVGCRKWPCTSEP